MTLYLNRHKFSACVIILYHFVGSVIVADTLYSASPFDFEPQLQSSTSNRTVASDTVATLANFEESRQPEHFHRTPANLLTVLDEGKSFLGRDFDDGKEAEIGDSTYELLCDGASTFIRHVYDAPGERADCAVDAPSRSLSLAECARVCRESKNCRGVSYTSPSDEKTICELCRTVENTLICLPADGSTRLTACAPPAGFERYARKLLPVVPTAVHVMTHRRDCLSACLADENCRAVNFHRLNGTCELLSRGWRHVIGGLVDLSEFDYFENTCIQSIERCPSGRQPVYLATKNTALDGAFTLAAGGSDTPMTRDTCRQRCDDIGDQLFCRSFQHSADGGICLISADTFYRVDISAADAPPTVGAINVEDFDLYEPICLNMELVGGRLAACPADFVFERVSEMNLIDHNGAAELMSVLANSTIEVCMEACLHDDDCASFAYSRVDLQCALLAAARGRAKNGAPFLPLAILEPLTDYYELACTRRAQLVRGDIVNVAENQNEMPKNDNSAGDTLAETVSLKFQGDNSVPNSRIDVIKATTTPKIKNITLTDQNDAFDDCNQTKIGDDSFLDKTMPDDKSIDSTTAKEGLSTSGAPNVNVNDDKNDSKELDVETQSFPPFEPIENNNDNFDTGSANDNLNDNKNSRNSSSDRKIDTVEPIAENCAPAGRRLAVGRNLLADFRAADGRRRAAPGDAANCARLCAAVNCATFSYAAKSGDCWLLRHRVTTGNGRLSMYTEADADYDIFALITINKDSNLECEYSTPMDSHNLRNMPINTVDTTINSKTHNSTVLASSKEQFTEAVDLRKTSLPEGPPRRNAFLHRLDGRDVTVAAECRPDGINVTFKTTGQKYTGAIYASERFASCREFVEARDRFATFISRRADCNAVDTDGWLNVLIVMSNDMVLPYDVTSKDDLFYHISCDYANKFNDNTVAGDGKNGQQYFAGEVISGLFLKAPSLQNESRPVDNTIADHAETKGERIVTTEETVAAGIDELAETPRRVRLRILRDGRPVRHVFIGERLTAYVTASGLDPSRLRVVDCNATHVGTALPPVPLIRHGCSLQPAIIGDMRRTAGGFATPLVAFRLDGSDQIDVTCSVAVCRWADCPPAAEQEPSCADIRRRQRRTAAIVAMQNDDMVTVNQRLTVDGPAHNNNKNVNNNNENNNNDTVNNNSENTDHQNNKPNDIIANNRGYSNFTVNNRAYNNNADRNDVNSGNSRNNNKQFYDNYNRYRNPDNRFYGYGYSNDRINYERRNYGGNNDDLFDYNNNNEIEKYRNYRPIEHDIKHDIKHHDASLNLLRFPLNDSSEMNTHCLNSMLMLALVVILFVLIGALAGLLATQCFRLRGRRLRAGGAASEFLPAGQPPFIYTTGTELSSGGGTIGRHLPRLNRYMT